MRLTLLLLLSQTAASYQREQHALTVRLALKDVRPAVEGEALIAACSQLADEAAELSAIDTYRSLMRHPIDYMRWAAGRSGSPATAGRMAATQQLLHVLTGGPSEAAREIARLIVLAAWEDLKRTPADAQERADALCALGFAFHVYGDSFSHIRLRNRARMYDTGVGHLFDSTRPDLPLLSPARKRLWREYVASAGALLDESAAERIESSLAAADEPAATARDKNGFNEAALRELLARTLAAAGGLKALAPFDRSRKKLGCQALVSAHAEANGISPAPRCEQTWARYRALAEKAFDEYDAAHPDAPSREALRVRYFNGTPFFKGTK